MARFHSRGRINAISTEPDVLIFVNGTYVKSHSVMVEDATIYGQILTTPFATDVNITFMSDDGQTEIVKVAVTEGLPIVNGEDGLRKIDFITSVCLTQRSVAAIMSTSWMGIRCSVFHILEELQPIFQRTI